MPPSAKIARVLVLPAAGDSGALDYSVPDDLADRLRIGMRVLVPLGSRAAVAIVIDTPSESPHPRLRPVTEILDGVAVADAALLELCRWLADYYLCSFAEAVSAALPGSIQMRAERIVELTERANPESVDFASTELRLSDVQRELVACLRAEGSQPLPALRRRFGKAVSGAITGLKRRGWITAADRVRPASGKTRHLRFYKVGRPLEDEERRYWMRRRSQTYAVYAYLAEHPIGRATHAELDGSFAGVDDKLRKLRSAGLVAVDFEEMPRQVLAPPPPPDTPAQLSAQQRAAVDEIAAVTGKRFQPFLLFGVTGSGKTEVYLHAIAAALAAGRSALVLVPEISLTHQIIHRIRARFRDPIAVLHSGLSDGERWDEWRRIAAGAVRIVVGARSAVFAPLADLGLIVVDEEHDSAYKQEDGVRYNGRDLAIMRAKFANCPVVLGSATPALESYVNATNQRYRLLRLPDRVASRPLPSIELIDLRRSNSMTKASLVSPALRAALSANLAGGNQSLVFLNRRGYSNFLQCHQCGDALQCPNCSVSLTLHQRWNALRCHHCDHTIPVPSACPGCGGLGLGAWGAGTEQVEAALKKLVPGARVDRLDRDTTVRKGSQQRILDAWQKGERDILVGTQMVAKGHDVHNVTLVGVLLADSGLNFPDFRAAERTFQTIAQVAGRAGRGDQPGRVIVQTFQPTHPSLKFAEQHDFSGFAEHELAERRAHGFPPFSRMVLLRCEGESPEATRQFAERLRAGIGAMPGLRVTGPTPAPLERVRRRYRWQIWLQGKDSAVLRRAAREARAKVRDAAAKADVRVLVDVDPYSML